MSGEVDNEVSRRDFLKVLSVTPFSRDALSVMMQALQPRFSCEVLNYHGVSANSMVNDALARIRGGLVPISLDEFVEGINGEREMPNGGTFMVTCDDGYRSQFTEGRRAVDTVAQRTGVFTPLTCFIMPRFMGKPVDENLDGDTPSFNDGVHSYMTLEQILTMISEGHSIQNHTADHIPVTAISGDRLSQQLEVAEEKIDAIWNLAEVERKYRAIAYPNGAYVGREQVIEEKGFDVAFTTVKSVVHSSTNRFTQGRFTRP
jgi:peptidoglycan/xylan/chitin deacetylase (PgdA/CDA1 family)